MSCPAARVSRTGMIPTLRSNWNSSRGRRPLRRARRAGARVGGRTEARPVAAEDKGETGAGPRRRDGGDCACADKVDKSASGRPFADRLGRSPDHVAEADRPKSVRQRTTNPGSSWLGEIVEIRMVRRIVCHCGPCFFRAETRRHAQADIRQPDASQFRVQPRLDQRAGAGAERDAAPRRSLHPRTPWPSPPPPPRRERRWWRWRSTAWSRSHANCARRCAGYIAANALRRHQEVDRLAAFEMAALHQRRARSKPQQRRSLAGHVGFASGDRFAKQGRSLREIGRQAVDARHELAGGPPRQSPRRSGPPRTKRS